MKENILYIDTSILGISLGLFSKSEGKFYNLFSREKKTDSCIATKVQNIIEKSQISPKDIERLVVSIGPGSFTGIRLGLAWAYGFVQGRQSHEIHCQGISSLSLAAQVLCRKNDLKNVLLILKSTKDSGFCAQIHLESGFQENILHIRIADIKNMDLFSWADDLCKIFVDSSWKEALEIFAQKNQVVEKLSQVEIADIAFEGMRAYSVKDKNKDSESFPLPLYLKASSVEEQLSLTKGQT